MPATRLATRRGLHRLWLLSLWILAAGSAPALAQPPRSGNPPRIPALRWEQRSDWINVRTDLAPAAVGDGKADDTDALQRGLDRLAAATREGGPSGEKKSALYFPPGVYRITRTLALTGPLLGALVVGSGRDTRLVWDGEAGGKMLHINGVCYSSFLGLELDGRNRAAVGFWYKSDKRFQTEVTHRHLAFRRFTDAGMLNDPTRAQALAETTFENCLFEDCRRGAAFPQFNDYDYTFDGCAFRRCDTAIECVHGNFYVRNCRFEGSRTADILDASEHGSSVRRCISSGSRAFILRGTAVAPLTVQDCRVDGWTDPKGAIQLSPPPVLLFDCVFTRPPRDSRGVALPPVRAHSDGRRVIVSGNRVTGAPGLFQPGVRPKLYAVPAGPPGSGMRSADLRFLQETARIPRRIFDARRDFDAKGDGQTDDTAAIQKALDAAATAAKDSLAYLPVGAYVISRPLRITGHDFFVGGSGLSTRLVWKGPPGGAMVEVRDPQRVTLENIAVGWGDAAPANRMDIHQAGSGKPSSMVYDGVYVFGMYQKEPFRRGLWFTGLGAQDSVVMPHVQGNLRFVDCGRATILANCSYEGSVVVEGKDRRRDGLLGFQTRLATIVPYGLYLRDSQNIVMSDFYVEQSDSGYRFEGAPGDPPGRAVIQGAKVEFTVPKEDPFHNTALDIRGYRGQVFFGPDQFYVEPKQMRFRQEGVGPVDLFLVGCAWYDCAPDVQFSPAARLFRIGNEALLMQTVRYPAEDAMDAQTLPALRGALDDLRRLGAADLRLNHPGAGR